MLKTFISGILFSTLLFFTKSAKAIDNPELWVEACSDKKSSLFVTCEMFVNGLRQGLKLSYYSSVQAYQDIFIILEKEEFINDTEKWKIFNERAKGNAYLVYGCIDGKTSKQLMAVFSKWLKNNPEKWHMELGEMMTESWVTAFSPSKSEIGTITCTDN
ncbi:hypothetical protein tloyanaT_20050 [Thalassotalea loyana]|uniref:Secreted protein n=1 Tax=Thalassotalea loyana TaxID=280483 RepID=A0ABQ6HCD7_9GAMM|nr:hypothetical protein [Thalassotalea loyana]GLX85753.1 hypothetical protein tloyanaT_20050 [Thalassotalea loyana]